MSLLVLLPGLSHCVVHFVSIILLIPFLNKKSPKIGGYIGMRLLSYLVLKMVYIAVLFVYVVWQGLLFGYFSCTSCLPGYCTQNMNISHFAGSTHNVVSI